MESQPHLTYITTAAFPSPKASSVQVMQMCAALAETGALVKLVARQSETADQDLFRYYGLAPTFKMEATPWPRWPRPADVFQMQAVLAERAPDWICYSRGRDLTAPALALLRGLRAAVEVHGLPASTRERVMLHWMARQRRARLIAISRPLQEHYQQQFGISTVLAPDAVDVRRFEPPLTSAEARQALGLGPGPWVVYVGGLYAGRGLETLLAAAVDLPVNLLIVGGRNGAEVAAWRAKALMAGAARVRFEGYQAPARIPLYMFAADILTMLYGQRIYTGSGEDITRWTSPLKLYEYLAAGRPIVSADVQAVHGLLEDGVNALLVKPDDVTALRDAIRRLLDSPRLAAGLAANARKKARDHTWTARATSILQELLSLD